jgi:hypothetical protein
LSNRAEQHQLAPTNAVDQEYGDEAREEILRSIAGGDDSRFNVVNS